jgi:hypothetical protein
MDKKEEIIKKLREKEKEFVKDSLKSAAPVSEKAVSMRSSETSPDEDDKKYAAKKLKVL